MPKLISELTTLRLGGPADDYVRAETASEIVDAVTRLDAAETPVLLVAGGSNLVVSDAGFRGTVVHLAGGDVRIEGDMVTADAGATWDDVVARTVEAGLGGLECLSGIPGSAGATPVQNVGAYGVEVADRLIGARLLDRSTGRDRWVEPAELKLTYRSSRLKHSDDEVVLAVRFRLTAGASAPVKYAELARTLGVGPGDTASPGRVREAVLALRRGKGMVLDEADHDTWSVGSFFTNPVVPAADAEAVLERITAATGMEPPRYPAPDGVKLSAGWLIERAGFPKGYSGGRQTVSLSTKHTLALTNRGGATTADLLALAAEVQRGVASRFAVNLLPEPVLVGESVRGQ
ncbi:UDP-N-acetylmuramate dehydrogenase [Tsukamurella sp. 8F]|uniref:UDP-N-acetylmuramate dehydrogenase n=1 Tax=unclassified Tsukamurella TaxID=2633480 RepID=UPI0023B8E214|nr:MULTISPECIES: UDP-N-acetylmuramate dehydrogenase [unclassified Tsukamurella]MDF0528321.1 UDP-N-acetylmuramate dehydrogenase [Tsukamurella sp. 8J]MDF0586146.1 UDP-N-acetylmuramate dehydrogenase [Tsukamurella sp. 8F]